MYVALFYLNDTATTENGYGKRTSVSEYRKTNRGTKGVGTIKLTERKGALAGALVVREHEELVFISENGMVQRTGVRGISRYGRLSQGVRLMNMKEGDRVSAVALVVESEEDEVVTADGIGEVSADGSVQIVDPGDELDPSAALDPEAAEAADDALEGTVPGEPDEVDLDEPDGPPTPGA